MLRLATPLVTLTAVLLHAVLGCCAHHAHAAEPAAVAEVHDHAGHAHGEHGHGESGHGEHEDDRHAGDCGHEEHAPHECGESECSWLTAPFVAPPALASAGVRSVLDVLLVEACVAERFDGRRPADDMGSGGPGDRLHTRVFRL